MEQNNLNLPTIAELNETNLEVAYKTEQLNLLLSQKPNPKWVKDHPYIKQEVNGQKVPYKYLPIDKVEYLLRRIFKRYRIEITGQGSSFNGVYVTVRVHWWNPVTEEWDYHDGIGASQLQTAAGKSAADLANINNGALSMAFPLAKTLAVKDACDHFGDLFGANLNRRDTIDFKMDSKLANANGDELGYPQEIKDQFDLMTDLESLEKYVTQVTANDPKLNKNMKFRSDVENYKKLLTPKPL